MSSKNRGANRTPAVGKRVNGGLKCWLCGSNCWIIFTKLLSNWEKVKINPNKNGLILKEPCYLWMMISQKVFKCQKFNKIAMPTSRSLNSLSPHLPPKLLKETRSKSLYPILYRYRMLWELATWQRDAPPARGARGGGVVLSSSDCEGSFHSPSYIPPPAALGSTRESSTPHTQARAELRAVTWLALIACNTYTIWSTQISPSFWSCDSATREVR
jgi:hypothetical protein